ncbi:MAG: hypothetical protein K2X37_13520, partial [Chitinophagaceae bacterium]|nr:hypothetical protein [Chitinophagaceae bacterium]
NISKRVVYARIEEARGLPNNHLLTPYKTEISQNRRKLCDTKLGLIALTNPSFSNEAIKCVSAGILQFLNNKKQIHGIDAVERLFTEKVGLYLYGSTNTTCWFGRISDSPANSNKQMWNESMIALKNGFPVETLLNIHNEIPRLFIQGEDDNKSILYSNWIKRMRVDGAGQFINEKWRGRKGKTSYTPTTLPGIISEPTTGFINIQARNRGIDMYTRIAPAAAPKNKVSAETSGNIYYQQLDLRNEVFGAGPSGSTGTGLAAAFTFGNFDEKTELFKEYLFAMIGYLVGGGMHSLHEVLSILRLIGLEYNTGTLLEYNFSNSPTHSGVEGLFGGRVSNNFSFLPKKFLFSKVFEDWKNEYYDIVVLGGIHWRYNQFG